MDFFGTLAKWFSENEGGLSVLLSALAVVISLLAIGAQNKGVLFEKRAAVYYEVGAIYKKLCCILEKGLRTSAATSRFLCAVILFSPGSEEYSVFEALRPLEQDWEKAYAAAKEAEKAAMEIQFLEDVRVKALMDRYAEIYQKKYLETRLTDEAELLYGKAIGAQVAALSRVSDELLLGLPVLTREDIQSWAEKTRPVLREFETKRVLGRMKRRLPR